MNRTIKKIKINGNVVGIIEFCVGNTSDICGDFIYYANAYIGKQWRNSPAVARALDRAWEKTYGNGGRDIRIKSQTHFRHDEWGREKAYDSRPIYWAAEYEEIPF